MVNISHRGGESSTNGFHGPKESPVVLGGKEVVEDVVGAVKEVQVLEMPTSLLWGEILWAVE